ncbi:MAG: hypothetical protein ACLUIQ_01545 [Dialister invisus]
MKVSRPCLQYHMVCAVLLAGITAQKSKPWYVVKTCDLFEGEKYGLGLKRYGVIGRNEFWRTAVLGDQLHAVQSVQQRQDIVSKRVI